MCDMIFERFLVVNIFISCPANGQGKRCPQGIYRAGSTCTISCGGRGSLKSRHLHNVVLYGRILFSQVSLLSIPLACKRRGGGWRGRDFTFSRLDAVTTLHFEEKKDSILLELGSCTKDLLHGSPPPCHQGQLAVTALRRHNYHF